MGQTKRLLKLANNAQQKHHFSAFTIAVIKKYNDDGAGRHAALLTYYSFLSIFPLLLVLTTLTDTLIGKTPHLEATIIKGVTNYFPLLGNQLAEHVHRIHAGGLALFSGIVFILYGTRGVANAFSRGVQDIWHIPESRRTKFPRTLLKSLGLVVIGGLGLITASILAGLATATSHGWLFRIISVAINVFILFWLFRVLLYFALSRRVTLRETRAGAATAAIGLVILQALGGYVLAHELKHLSALYSYFAVALGLLFWLYLQTQVLYYAIEIATVSSRKLWPRSLDPSHPSAVDLHLLASQLK